MRIISRRQRGRIRHQTPMRQRPRPRKLRLSHRERSGGRITLVVLHVTDVFAGTGIVESLLDGGKSLLKGNHVTRVSPLLVLLRL